jgi:hypothetical protein
MPIYEHSQPGTLLRIVLGASAIVTGGVMSQIPGNASAAMIASGSVTVILIVCLFLFHSLTVTVTHEDLRLKFGNGPIGKRFAVSEIESATRVTNHWYYGWGIRLTPHGWLFNVSGFDAVQIQLKNGRKYRIGTDEPAELLSAIETVMSANRDGGGM